MNKKLLWLVGVTAIFGVMWIWSPYTHTQFVKYTQQTKAGLIDVAALKTWAAEIASDDYAGRQAGYEGNNKAAAYIAKQFQALGIKPGGNFEETNDRTDYKRSYFQHFTFDIGSGKLDSQNVVGIIEGSDQKLKDQIIVLGAHYDHVGQTGLGTHYARLGRTKGIWHGADDNASGTVTVMAIAKAFAEGKIHPKRTVVFILFSAEEGGLLGSEFYCKHPTVGKITDYVFMLNLDMIGRNPNLPTEIKGLGTAEGTYLADVVNDALAQTGLSAALQKDAVVNGGDSDHSSFGGVGISFVFFFTGFHPDYHSVSDTADKLAYDHMALIGETALRMLKDIADRPSPPIFKQ